MASQMYARYVPPEDSQASRVTRKQLESNPKRSIRDRSWNTDDEPSPKKVKTWFGALDTKSIASTGRVSKANSRIIPKAPELQARELDASTSGAVGSSSDNHKVEKKARISFSGEKPESDNELHDRLIKKKARIARHADDTDEKQDASNRENAERWNGSHTNAHRYGAEDYAVTKQKTDRGQASQNTNGKDNESSLVSGTEEQDERNGKHREILAKYHKSTAKSHKHIKTRSNIDSPTPSVDPSHIEDARVLAGLMPLPQPAPVDESTARPAFSALPSWLQHPVLVTSTKKRPLEGFQINPKLLSLLKKWGYTEAFAVQSAVIPLLLPGPEQHDGDICISAATGSGKTLAYVLPLVESLRGKPITRLRGLIIVPTRELVLQAREVCEMCCAGSGLKVQTTMGSRSFKAEQEELIEIGQRYDPLTVERVQRLVQRTGDNSDYDFGLDDEYNHADKLLPGHIIEYRSKADILICTPGRLVEHIRSTSGFTLEHVQWLVIDEADKLLSHTFQGWIDVVMGGLERQKPSKEFSLSEKILYRMSSLRAPKPARKVILSATMTKDLSKLGALHLRNPKLVVLDNVGSLNPDEDLRSEKEVDGGVVSQETYDLPFSLQESAIPAGDGGDKPLYLLHLLQNNILKKTNDLEPPRSRGDAFSSTQSSSNENFGSSHNSEPSTSSSESDENSLSSSDSISPSGMPEPHLGSNQVDLTKGNHGVLIFTKSNESAIRLTRLLTLLHPPYGSVIGTLTSTHASAIRRRILRSFTSMKLSILIASDLVARGMDIANLAHVINYDLPTSIRGYVHRVGRTARAGNEGKAWSLVTDKEARWFWNAIVRGKELRRSREKKVARYRLKLESISEEQKKKYEEALRTLGEEVRGSR